MKSQDGWVTEAKDLFRTCLGMKLVTRGKTWSAIGDERWRLVLYSEFVFDLPVPLPDSLAGVPCAQIEARPLVEDLCDQLRNDRRTQAVYIERAEQVEKDLNLASVCQPIQDLGMRDTFPFEERSFFRQAVEALRCGQKHFQFARRVGLGLCDLGRSSYSLLPSVSSDGVTISRPCRSFRNPLSEPDVYSPFLS